MDSDEFKIIIDETNSWKDELMLRVGLERAVVLEIRRMPWRFMKLKTIPYHLYPFTNNLNSKKDSERHYVLHACAAYYKSLRDDKWYFIMAH